MIDLDKVSHDKAARAYYVRHHKRPNHTPPKEKPVTPKQNEGHWLIFASWALTMSALLLFFFSVE